MTDIDRRTGLPIDNLTSAFQSVEIILSTRLGSRILRREFGGGVVDLLGRLVSETLFDAFRQLVGTAIDLWEPRLIVRSITLAGSVEDLRSGKIGLDIEVDYRPRGHLGDFTVERVENFSISFASNNIKVLR